MKGGWVSATLGDVLDVLKNGVNCKQDKNGCGQKISRIESIANATFDCGRVGYAELSEPDKVKYRLQQGDILFSHINSAIHVGKTAVFDAEDDVYHGVNLLLMRPKSYLSSAYLELYLKYIFEQGYWRTICKQSVNQASVNQQDIKRVPLRFPKERAEQKRIVAILDETFAGISQAVANAEKNLANARELFESYLNSVFTQKGEGWVEYQLQKLTTKIGSGATPKGGASSYKDEGISLIRSLNVYDRYFADRKLAFIDDLQANKLSNVIVEEGDVLFNITGASIARCCIAPIAYLPARVNQHVSILRPKQDKLLTDFLCYLMTSRPYKGILLGIGDEGGSTRQAITKKQLQELVVSIPKSKEEQEKVVDKLNEISFKTQHLQTIYQQKLTALTELKQSILQKAFAGELTADVVQKKVNA